MLDLLWLTSWFLKNPRSGWQGTMQAAMVANHPGKAEIIFLPMIDLLASDETCAYSSLNFTANQGKQFDFCPIVTFV